jgi:hypothetical protein
MIHSRPGYAPRTSDEVPAKLNADMIPAIHRRKLTEASPLKQPSEALLDARTEAAMARLAKEHPAPEILVNPHPSDPPQVLEPGK